MMEQRRDKKFNTNLLNFGPEVLASLVRIYDHKLLCYETNKETKLIKEIGSFWSHV